MNGGGRECPDSAAVRPRFGSLTARQVRADGRADEWTTRRGEGRLEDLCPACTEVVFHAMRSQAALVADDAAA